MIPTLDISKGRLIGVPFDLARYDTGKVLKPTAIILHETAGPLTKGNCVTYFKSKACAARKVNCHLVIDRDGTITQMVPFTKRANHAGQSSWKGKMFCNSFTIGIELVGPGEIDKTTCRAWFQKSGGFDKSELKATPKAFLKSHQDRYWLPYTKEQIASTKAACRAIFEEYPDCNEILTHYLVSPGRKVDVNPLFPLDEVRRYAEGQNEPEVAPPTFKPEVVGTAIAANDTAPVLVSQPQLVHEGTNQPMSLTDLSSVSRHLGLLARFRFWVRSLTGVSIVGYFGGAIEYTKGVYNELASFVTNNALLLALVSVGITLWVVERALRGGQVAAQEGRYIPSGMVGQDSPLAGPSEANLAGS